MQHANDIDPFIDRHVEDNVPTKWKTAHAWRQFVPCTTHLRLCRQHPELPVELIHPAIGGGRNVIGDVVPDFQGVGLCKRPPRYLRHSSDCRFGNSSDARFVLDGFGIPGFAPPARGVEVWHQDKFVSRATPLDAYANCFVRRNRPTQNIDPDTPPSAPRNTGLVLSDLSERKPDNEDNR